jgi:ferredoxin
MTLFFISIVVSLLILGGPLTLFALIKIASSIFGGIKPKFVRLESSAPDAPNLGLFVAWDEVTYPDALNRVKVDFTELVRGGRSTSFSFTFEDKAAKKRSFVIPMKITPEDIQMLTDNGVAPRAIENSYAIVEIENTKGEVIRKKILKKDILAAINKVALVVDTKEIDLLPATMPDAWAVLTRVFPWRKVVAEVGEPTEKKAAVKKGGKAAAPTLVDFIVTKVWIEPGCIVCDACENEAPAVFKVLADTCIVVENADLTDGASIKAAAEGCPVDVIKFDKAPKPAA